MSGRMEVGPFLVGPADLASVATVARDGFRSRLVRHAVAIAITSAWFGGLAWAVLFYRSLALPALPASALVVGLVLVLVLYRVTLGAAGRVQFRQLMAAGTMYTVTLDERGVLYRAGGALNALRWRAVKRVIVWEKRLYFFFDDNSAVIVPRSAFSNDTAAHAFLAFAQARWKEAHG